ncbi:MAG: glycerophosphodiester phosphodiesterase family protein [Pirellulaceae bacterium]
MARPFLCIGHRGAMGHEPENTLRSIRKGIELGATWIEIDVQRVEEQLVVFHDERLDRTTNGRGLLAEQSFAELRKLDAGRGERIPTLEEVFETIGERVGLNIELKGPETAEPTVRRIHARDDFDYKRLLVSSFDIPQLRRVHELDAEIPLAGLYSRPSKEALRTATALGFLAINVSLRHVTSEFVKAAHEQGLQVLVYTVNEPDDIARMMSLGVDGVFSDYPDRVLRASRK